MTCKEITTLNRWTDEQKNQAKNYLISGDYVAMFSYCLGHELASMMKYSAEKWAKETFGNRLEIINIKGIDYFHLKD